MHFEMTMHVVSYCKQTRLEFYSANQKNSVCFCLYHIQVVTCTVLKSLSFLFFYVRNWISFDFADFPAPKRTISKDGEIRREYEEEMRKV